jgi:lysophospholipase L1-like esterase
MRQHHAETLLTIRLHVLPGYYKPLCPSSRYFGQMPYIFIAKYALSPLLLLQGRRARKTALHLPEADGERRGYVSNDGSAKPLNLLFVGDSTMAGVGAKHQRAALGLLTAQEVSVSLCRAVRWQIIARSGLKTSQMEGLVEGEDLLDADVLITALGGNDVIAQTKPSKFVDSYAKLVASLLPTSRSGLAIVSGLPPLDITPAIPQPLRWFFGIYAQKLDRELRRWSLSSPSVSYLSLRWAADPTRLATDRFHPGEGLYREWAHRIAQQIVHDLRAISIS